jgi:hypothetical protein
MALDSDRMPVDIAFTVRSRPGAVPSVRIARAHVTDAALGGDGARQILEATEVVVEHQADGLPHGPREVAFTLAGVCFNGPANRRDMADSLS